MQTTTIDLRTKQELIVRKMTKKVYEVQVEIAATSGTLETLEGKVSYLPGDAIVTGVRGERWPVPKAAFDRKYAPVNTLHAEHSGNYLTRPVQVLATQLLTSYTVQLDTDRGEIQGHAGDWLVQYEDGSQAIIAADIFLQSYEPGPALLPLLIGVAGDIDEPLLTQLILIQRRVGITPCIVLQTNQQAVINVFRISGQQLIQDYLNSHPLTYPLFHGNQAAPEHHLAAFLMKHCSFVIVSNNTSQKLESTLRRYQTGLPYWAKSATETDATSHINDLFNMPQPASVITPKQVDVLSLELAHVSSALIGKHKRYSRWQQCKNMLPDWKKVWCGLSLKLPHQEHAHAEITVITDHITELKLFNEEAIELQGTKNYTDADCALEMHKIADDLASKHQDAWQTLVFSTTKRIAATGGLIHCLLHFQFGIFLSEFKSRLFSLFGLGLLATFAFACFTEISGGCKDTDMFASIGCSSENWKETSGIVCLSVYLTALLISLIRYSAAKRAEHERKHQDYRFLAEGLRIQYLWNAAGLDYCVADVLPASDSEDNRWVRNALHALRFHSPHQIQKNTDATLNRFRSDFIEHQIEYHQDKLLDRREIALNYLAARARIGLSFFTLFVITIILNTLFEHIHLPAFDGMTHHFLIIGAVISLGWWAANKKVAENFGLESEIRRGKTILDVLKKSTIFLDEHESSSYQMLSMEKRKVFLKGIGRAFISDQASWHTLHRERPVEAATGG